MKRPMTDRRKTRESQTDNDKLKRKTVFKKRNCRFCGDKNIKIDYKNAKLLSSFLSERAKLVPRRISGNCALHQRRVTSEIKKARIMALLQFSTTQQN